MRVLVTGANGFVGKPLVEALAPRHEVIAVTRRDVPVKGAVDTRIVRSIDGRTDWSGLLTDVDVIVHLAARVHVMREKADNPLEAFREINARGTGRLAEAAAEQGVRKLVFLSSIKVNGEGRGNAPYVASDAPAPVDPYGLSKLEAEQELAQVAQSSGLTSVVMRPTVIYGPDVKGNIERLVRLISARVPIPFGAVKNARSVLSLRNLITWVEAAIESSTTPRHAVLISDPEPISTTQLIRSLAAGMDYRPLLIPVPVSMLRLGGLLLGQSAAIQRLVGDLAVNPTTDVFPGIELKLRRTEDELAWFGKQTRQKARG